MPAKAASRERDALRPKRKVWEIPGYGECVQDPLTFFEKGDLLDLIATALDRAAQSGVDLDAVTRVVGISPAELAAAKDDPARLSAMTRDGKALVSALAGAMRYAPDLVLDLFLLALSIPEERRPEAREALYAIDDPTAFGILETFVEQNEGQLRDFAARSSALAGRARRLWPGGVASATSNA